MSTATAPAVPSAHPPMPSSPAPASACSNAHATASPLTSSTATTSPSVSASAPPSPSPSETATSQLPNLPNTGVIWAELANLAISAFSDPLILRLRAFIDRTPHFAHSHLNMLGPIVVRHVAHMLEDLNDTNINNRPCKSCNINISTNKNSNHNITASTSTNSTNDSLNCNNNNNNNSFHHLKQQQQQRRPRSLLTSSMSSSLSPTSSASNHTKDNNIEHTHEHGHNYVHAHHDRDHHVAVNGAGYRHLAYQAVRLNKILPESVSSARPNSLCSYQRQIIRKLSITTPSPCPSRPQSPEKPLSSYNNHQDRGEHEEEGHTTGLNDRVDVTIDNARPVDIDQLVAQFPACEQQNQQTFVSNRPHSRPPRTQLRPQSLQAVRQQNPNCWDSVRNRNSSSGRYARCVVMDFRPRAQKPNHVAQQQSSSQSPPLPSPRVQRVVPPAYVGPCRDTTNRPLSPTVGPRLQEKEDMKSCLFKSSTKSSSASTQVDIEDEYNLDDMDDDDVVDNNNNRNARDNIENTNVNLCSHQPLPSGVSTRWRTQHGKPDPSRSLPRAGIDATLLSHSARKLKRSVKHCRHGGVGGGGDDDDDDEDEDPPSSHETSIEREHGNAAGQVSETVDAHGSGRRTNMDGVHSRLVLLRRQRERRRSPLR